MGLTKRQRDAVIGMLLGDAWLQKTGKRSARLRLKHSVKQRDYIYWKYELLKNYMQSEPKLIRRYNPIWEKSYSYYRCQTHSSPEFGKMRRKFYENNCKTIPADINKILKSPFTLAIWYMDDGYYYKRDKISCIYLKRLTAEETERIINCLQENFNLYGRIKIKKELPVIYFSPKDTKKLTDLVRPYIIPSLNYKLPPPP